MKKAPEGYRIGHWTDLQGITGCTVILCPPETIGSCDVRGNSPGSRELALLDPRKSMREIHAVLLTGGSAFGLAAADGVMRYLEEHGKGYQTPWARVPIVPAAVVFDLNIGSALARPDAMSGYRACGAAAEQVMEGSVGAGTGATLGKWAGIETRMKGGVGYADSRQGDLEVSALAVVNAVGDVIDADGSILAGARDADRHWLGGEGRVRELWRLGQKDRGNTTLVVVITNARLSKVDACRVAERAHDGMARAIVPVHTSFDGDVVFALSSGPVETSMDLVAELAADVTARAIRRGALCATTLAGVPSRGEDPALQGSK
jgi:L-aminopeptidase/D-esterase-like protein